MSIEEVQNIYRECMESGKWREKFDPYEEEINAAGYYLISPPSGGKFLVYADESFFIDNHYYTKYQPLWDSKRYFIEYKLWVEDGPKNRAHRQIKSKTKREAIFARDNYTCQHCGSTENLTIDHIEPWSITRDDTFYNLKTLCRSCNEWKADSTGHSRQG
jgi:hypothetical protein